MPEERRDAGRSPSGGAEGIGGTSATVISMMAKFRAQVALVFLAVCPVLSAPASAQGMAPKESSMDVVGLFGAASLGDVSTIKRMLAKGVPVDARDPSGWTPLMVAASSAKVPAVRALLEAGANVNASSSAGETPLMAAALTGDREIVQLLLQRGADRAARTLQGLTAGETARRVKDNELAKLLQPVAGVQVASSGGSAACERVYAESARNARATKWTQNCDENRRTVDYLTLLTNQVVRSCGGSSTYGNQFTSELKIAQTNHERALRDGACR